jgi:uncharacterized protein YecT (DUF1311 family)
MMNKKATAIGGVVACAALIGLTTGCSSLSSIAPTGTAATPSTATPSTAAPSTSIGGTSTPTASTAATTAGFVAIVEPWDPGHPAQTQAAPSVCGTQSSTLAIEQCYEAKTENTDARIDAVQQARYASATPSGQAAILGQDSAWLQARGPVCQAAFQSGGTIDGISISACLLDESTARLDAVQGITPPEALLKSTDNSTDPNALSWYTTPEGSRIAELDTQGDQTGGAIIAWIVIGGANGFVVNPQQFYFSDGSFTDPGVVQPPNPAYHRVGTGQEYQFGIDYSHLSAAPAGNPAEGFVYAPGTPAAIWQ